MVFIYIVLYYTFIISASNDYLWKHLTETIFNHKKCNEAIQVLIFIVREI